MHVEECIAKQAATVAAGYNFVYIIDKNYTNFVNIIQQLKNKNI
jgi:adenosine/AMP kinase